MIKLELISTGEQPDLSSLAQIIVDLIKEGLKSGKYRVDKNGQIEAVEGKIDED